MQMPNDPTPHPHIHDTSSNAQGSKQPKAELSIWFFCGILTLGYGLVLLVQGGLEYFQLLGQHPPTTVLANLHPTLWWGLLLSLFGGFYTVSFRPGRG